MSTVITRVGFCPACKAAHRPFRGEAFLVYGSYRGGYYVREATRAGIEGYTPHLFILESVARNGTCTVSTVCAMHGCSVEYRFSKQDSKMMYGVIPDKWERIELSTGDYNALLMYRRDPYFTI